MVDEDVQLLVLGACEYVLLHGKREFEDMIKVEMGEIILDYPVNPISSQEFLNMEEGGIEVRVIWEILGLPLLALKMEEWPINQRMWVVSMNWRRC